MNRKALEQSKVSKANGVQLLLDREGVRMHEWQCSDVPRGSAPAAPAPLSFYRKRGKKKNRKKRGRKEIKADIFRTFSTYGFGGGDSLEFIVKKESGAETKGAAHLGAGEQWAAGAAGRKAGEAQVAPRHAAVAGGGDPAAVAGDPAGLRRGALHGGWAQYNQDQLDQARSDQYEMNQTELNQVQLNVRSN